jgi:hypothetical protein
LDSKKILSSTSTQKWALYARPRQFDEFGGSGRV